MTITEHKNIHFIGIGGIGTSSIAQILHEKGKNISGSDQTSSSITTSLKLKGITVYLEHNKKNISKKITLVVYSPAIPKSNPELIRAKELGIQTISYPQALGELTKEYFTIAIAGTHGKSTTTAMTALIAKKAGFDPTVVIGTKVKQFGNKNYRVGKSNLLIMEACEYKKSFIHFKPDILIITNIEADHLDYFKNLKNYLEAFKKLVKNVGKKGVIIYNEDSQNSKEAVKNAKASLISWSEKDKKTNLRLKNKVLINNFDQKMRITINPGVKGEFNVHNGTFAAIANYAIGAKNKFIEQAIEDFNGTWRRMEHKRTKINTTFIDDYAHHPTEIEMTLTAIKEAHPKSKILCIFQPHQYSRTYLLLKDFGKAFYNADEVFIPNIYKVRDSQADIKKINTDDLINEIKKNGVKAHNTQSIEQTADIIKKDYKKYDIIVTMGAGDINKIYKYL